MVSFILHSLATLASCTQCFSISVVKIKSNGYCWLMHATLFPSDMAYYEILTWQSRGNVQLGWGWHRAGGLLPQQHWAQWSWQVPPGAMASQRDPEAGVWWKLAGNERWWKSSKDKPHCYSLSDPRTGESSVLSCDLKLYTLFLGSILIVQ